MQGNYNISEQDREVLRQDLEKLKTEVEEIRREKQLEVEDIQREAIEQVNGQKMIVRQQDYELNKVRDHSQKWKIASVVLGVMAVVGGITAFK